MKGINLFIGGATMSELLTADELADRLKVRPDTVRSWSRQGRIPAIRITHKVVRFDFDAVVKALASASGSEVSHDA